MTSLSQAAQRLIRQCEEVKSQAQQTVLQKGWAPVGGDFLKPRVVDIQQAEASVARSLIEIEHRIRQVGPSDTQLATRLALQTLSWPLGWPLHSLGWPLGWPLHSLGILAPSPASHYH